MAANASLLKPALYRNPATGPFALAAKSLAGNDLCSIADLSTGEIGALLKLAHAVKTRPRDYRRALDAKQLVMFFEKASLRTRLSFESGINTLGGNAIFVDQTQSPLGERESLGDISRNVERWTDAIVLRTYSHETITEMAQYTAVPVINALSDLEHPCQAIADFMTLEEKFGTVRGLKFVYVGDGNNVCHSLMLTAALLGLPVDNWPVLGGMGNASWVQISGHSEAGASPTDVRWRLDVWNASAQVRYSTNNPVLVPARRSGAAVAWYPSAVTGACPPP